MLLTAPDDIQDGAEVSLSLLQHLQDELLQAGMGKARNDAFAGVGLEIFELRPGQDETPAHVATSYFAVTQEVSVDIRARRGVSYLVHVQRCEQQPKETPGARSAAIPSCCSLSVYCPSISQLVPFSGHVDETRRAAYEAAALSESGQLLFAEAGGRILTWRDPEGRVTVFLFDGGTVSRRLLASFEWTLSNVLLQEDFPRAPSAEDAAAARTGASFTRQRLLDLQAGQKQLVVLTWVDPGQPCSMKYRWQAAAASCLECGEPVMRMEPRFSGDFFTYEASAQGSAGRVHAECRDAYKVRRAQARTQGSASRPTR